MSEEFKSETVSQWPKDDNSNNTDEHINKKIKLEVDEQSPKSTSEQKIPDAGTKEENVNTADKQATTQGSEPQTDKQVEKPVSTVTEPVGPENGASVAGQAASETAQVESEAPEEHKALVEEDKTAEADRTTEEATEDASGGAKEAVSDGEKPAEGQQLEVAGSEQTKQSTEESKDNEGTNGAEDNDFSFEDLKKMNTKEQLLELIKLVFPNRKHLGSLVYNPTTTWLTLQTSQLSGLKDEHFERFEELRESYREKLQEEYYAKSTQYIPMIPPLPSDYINYLLEVKIPYRFIRKFKNELDEGVILRKREIWGGKYGIYTDDSDILTILTHLGFFTDTIDLKEWNPTWQPQDIIYPQINEDDEIKGDLSVTLLLLPGLDQYESQFKNGINSRPWKKLNRHDGLSIAVHSIKWEIEGSYLRDKSFFKRYQTELTYDAKYLKQQVESRDGWQFDAKYYRQIKEKYNNMEKSADSSQNETNAADEGSVPAPAPAPKTDAV